MDVGKGIIRIVTTVLYIITLVIFISVVAISTAKTNGLTNWTDNSFEITVLLSSFITLILINMLRLKLGITMALTKDSVQHQFLFLIFLTLVLISFSLLTIHSIYSYTMAAILFVTGFAGCAIIKQRMWEIFTDIRQTDHAVFRKRLIKFGLLIGALAVLAFFNSTDSSYLYSLMGAVYLGYLISSFFIGFIVVRKYFSPVVSAVSGWINSEQKQDNKVARRVEEDNKNRMREGFSPIPMAGPKSDLGIAKFSGLLVFISMLIAAIVVGVFMIPFYIYVLITKKVTVSGSAVT